MPVRNIQPWEGDGEIFYKIAPSKRTIILKLQCFFGESCLHRHILQKINPDLKMFSLKIPVDFKTLIKRSIFKNMVTQHCSSLRAGNILKFSNFVLNILTWFWSLSEEYCPKYQRRQSPCIKQPELSLSLGEMESVSNYKWDFKAYNGFSKLRKELTSLRYVGLLFNACWFYYYFYIVITRYHFYHSLFFWIVACYYAIGWFHEINLFQFLVLPITSCNSVKKKF